MVNFSAGSQSVSLTPTHPMSPMNARGAMRPAAMGFADMDAADELPSLSPMLAIGADDGAWRQTTPRPGLFPRSDAPSVQAAKPLPRLAGPLLSAQAQVAMRVDAEAAALAVLGERQRSMRELRRRRTEAENAGAIEHPLRIAEQQQALAAEFQARHALPLLKQRVAQHRQLLAAAQGATPGLTQALDRAIRDPQHTVQQEQAITAARNNLLINRTAVSTHRDQLQAAQADLQAATDHHVAAQLRLTAAQAAMARLATVRQALAAVVDAHTPDLQAHAAAARAALTDAGAAVQAQQRLADSTAHVAVQARDALIARDEAALLQARVDEAARRHAAAQERLAPLQQRVTERLADLKRARLALPRNTAGGVAAQPPAAEVQQRIDRLTAALSLAQADLKRQHLEVNRLQGLLCAEAGPLALRRAEVDQSTGPQATANAQRVARGAAAAAVDTAARASAAARDALQVRADAAHRVIEQAVDALCEEMRNTGKRAV
ncbi:hypothetical protein ACQ86G_22230 [Roseateles chitinivorans]|uniref:hypothetical protein n=1 Tax=Roseateles chitinivorans TaxID=2917965 RepID=UPI003D678C0E